MFVLLQDLNLKLLWNIQMIKAVFTSPWKPTYRIVNRVEGTQRTDRVARVKCTSPISLDETSLSQERILNSGNKNMAWLLKAIQN